MAGTRAYDSADVARRVPEEPGGSGRTPFARDRARVLHSGALRRLAGKTQVVEPGGLHEPGSVPRTRLTHSLECAQVGRELAGALGADPDLVDAACLAHDLGHPPFGHNGERALDEVAQPCGGFEGNAQSLRVLTRLEVKVDGAGLNLTRAALDAATKYPWSRTAGDGGVRAKYGHYPDDAGVFRWLRDGAPDGRRCFEAQLMDWADDVAYSVHDLEDGIVAGLVPLPALASAEERAQLCALAGQLYLGGRQPAGLGEVLDDLLGLPLWPARFDGGRASLAAVKALTSGMIGRFCRAAWQATVAAHGPGPHRRYGADVVVPERVRAECALLKAVAARYVMSRPGVERVQARERDLLADLVARLLARPDRLDPARAEDWAGAPDDAARLRVVVDAVASLTDAAAVALHASLRAA